MTKKKPEAQRRTVVVDPEANKGKYRVIGGSMSDDFNMAVLNQAVNSLWRAHSDEAELDAQHSATIATFMGMKPRDELEGMLVAQLIAANAAAMECYRRAMIEQQTYEGRRENLSQANKLSRTYVTLVEALNRHRGKGQQKVTVEHVHVHAGGQAVVGNVETGGGAKPRIEGQSHAQIADASEPALWSKDESRDALPVSRDG